MTRSCGSICWSSPVSTIAGGFGPLAGQIFRIGTMGYGSTVENVLLILRELEAALKLQGYKPAADGAAAAEKALSAAV